MGRLDKALRRRALHPRQAHVEASRQAEGAPFGTESISASTASSAGSVIFMLRAANSIAESSRGPPGRGMLLRPQGGVGRAKTLKARSWDVMDFLTQYSTRLGNVELSAYELSRKSNCLRAGRPGRFGVLRPHGQSQSHCHLGAALIGHDRGSGRQELKRLGVLELTGHLAREDLTVLDRQFFDRGAGLEIELDQRNPEGVGSGGGVEVIYQVLLIGTARQSVDAIFGSAGVVMPSGTLTARCTLNTSATA